MAGAAIRCEQVVKTFGAVRALDGLDLEVPRGKVVGFLGPNGAGKSTAIRAVMDLGRPDSGRVEVLGAEPRSAGPGLRARVGYLPDDLRLDPRTSVAETLDSWARIRGGVDPAYVTDLCDRLGLDRGRATKGLSTGNRRKVGIVAAFMSRPELVVLDEPTSGLDPLVKVAFTELVQEAVAAGSTVFLSSHVLDEVRRLAEHVVVIRRGQVVASGTVGDLAQETRQPFEATFAGPAPVDVLSAITGVTELTGEGETVRGAFAGTPGPLLAALATHDVVRLHLPEPSLEDAFLRYYDDRTDDPGRGR